MPRGYVDLALEGADRKMKSFLETLSKYPSHIRLNLSRISFSTSSSASLKTGGCDGNWVDFSCSAEDSVPGSAEEDICLLEPVGGVMPKNGLEKYFKNVVKRGNENKLESFDN